MESVDVLGCAGDDDATIIIEADTCLEAQPLLPLLSHLHLVKALSRDHVSLVVHASAAVQVLQANPGGIQAADPAVLLRSEDRRVSERGGGRGHLRLLVGSKVIGVPQERCCRLRYLLGLADQAHMVERCYTALEPVIDSHLSDVLTLLVVLLRSHGGETTVRWSEALLSWTLVRLLRFIQAVVVSLGLDLCR